MSNGREIRRLLHRRRAQHRPAGRACRHHIAVIAKDGKPLRRQRPRRDVKHHRRQFAGDFVHVRNHQQQTLRRGERGALRAGLQRAMDGARRAAFALQLDDRGHGAPEIFQTTRRPIVRPFAHRR